MVWATSVQTKRRASRVSLSVGAGAPVTVELLRSHICYLYSLSIRKLYQISAVFDSNGAPLEDAQWTELTPFVYRSGRQEPPELLRALPDQNYLNPGIRVFGITLMAIALIGATLSFLWVCFCRNHAILQRAQPCALLLICFGSFVIAWSIFPLSFDESYGRTETELSRGCMSECTMACQCWAYHHLWSPVCQVVAP